MVAVDSGDMESLAGEKDATSEPIRPQEPEIRTKGLDIGYRRYCTMAFL